MKKLLFFILCFAAFNTNAQTNLLDSSLWEQGIFSPFEPKGGNANNNIVVQNGPHAGDDVPTWEAIPNGGYPGFQLSSISVDPTKTYRFAVWVKMENNLTQQYAFYINANTTDGTEGFFLPHDNSQSTDAYLSSWTLSNLDQWYLLVMYIKGSDFTNDSYETGLFEKSGNNTYPTLATLVNFKTNVASIDVWAMAMSSNSITDKVVFYDPRMEVVDGSEPSLTDLIIGSVGTDDPNGGGYWTQTGNDINYTNGFVGIGTASPDAPLTVKGRIHTTEVKVDMLGALVPDYVFYDDYHINTLEEIQEYIREYGHLPNIPSAKEIEANGIELGLMNMKLLEKIEELTLYILEQDNKQKQQDQKQQQLEQRIKDIENQN